MMSQNPLLQKPGAVKAAYEAMRVESKKALVGQDEVFEQMVIALLARGHVLLEGVPGTAKTLAAKILAHLIRADFKRVQFTPDLMPSDIVGTQVFDLNTSKFYLKRGPIFTNILLADEINRAPAKTQSALLEAMEERQVTIEGDRYELPEPFVVLATQNPVEYEGTYPLPEAQLDRFLFKTLVTYASPEAEAQVLRRYHNGFDAHRIADTGLKPVLSPDRLQVLRQEVMIVRVEDGILTYITAIAMIDGEITDRQFEPERFKDPEVWKFLENVKVKRNAELSAMYPDAVANIVHVDLADDRRLTKRVDYPLGNAKNRLKDSAVEGKFLGLVERIIGESRAKKITELVWKLDEAKNVDALTRALQMPEEK